MTARDHFDGELESWLVSEARGDVPTDLHASLIARTRRTRQWPSWLASVRLAAAKAWPGPFGATAARVADQPASVRLAVVAALLMAAAVAAVLVAGAFLYDGPTGRILVHTSRILPEDSHWPSTSACDTLHQVDARTGTTTELVGCAPWLAVSPDGRYAARVGEQRADGLGSSAVVMDLRDASVTTLANEADHSYHGAWWSWDSRWLSWDVCEGSDADPQSGIGRCFDVFFSVADGFRMSLDLPPNVSTNYTRPNLDRPPTRPISLQATPSGGSVWIANAIGRGWRLLAEFDDPLPTEAVMSPDGRTIAVVAGTPKTFGSSPADFIGVLYRQPELWLVDADGGVKRKVELPPIATRYQGADGYELSLDPGTGELFWSPDGSRLMVVVTVFRLAEPPLPRDWWISLGREILIIDPDVPDVVHSAASVEPDDAEQPPLWSPDSRFLVQLRLDGGLEVSRADGRGSSSLATVPRPQDGYEYFSYVIAWLPDPTD